jgi:hypothetical protein
MKYFIPTLSAALFIGLITCSSTQAVTVKINNKSDCNYIVGASTAPINEILEYLNTYMPKNQSSYSQLTHWFISGNGLTSGPNQARNAVISMNLKNDTLTRSYKLHFHGITINDDDLPQRIPANAMNVTLKPTFLANGGPYDPSHINNKTTPNYLLLNIPYLTQNGYQTIMLFCEDIRTKCGSVIVIGRGYRHSKFNGGTFRPTGAFLATSYATYTDPANSNACTKDGVALTSDTIYTPELKKGVNATIKMLNPGTDGTIEVTINQTSDNKGKKGTAFVEKIEVVS